MTASLGLFLPSFSWDARESLEVAQEAERTGFDGVFAFDHIFRDVRNGRRPAQEPFVILGAIASLTSRIQLGTLVARASLRYPAVLAHNFDTLNRIAPGRVIAALGAGDEQSKAEMDAFGLPFGTREDRIAMLGAAVDACLGRGYPVWVGANAQNLGELAQRIDGWNLWTSDVKEFETQRAMIETDRAHFSYTVATQITIDDPNAAEYVKPFMSADWCIVGVRGGIKPEQVSAVATLVENALN